MARGCRLLSSRMTQHRVHCRSAWREQETEVAAGENYGKTLHHDFVVSSFKRVDMKQAGETGTWSGTLALAHARHESTREAIAVWVTPRDGQYALQAAGGFISQ